MSETSNGVVWLTRDQAISVNINPAAYKGDVAMPNIHAGTVAVGEADSDVSVTVTGAYPDYYLNFVLPPADDGEDGITPNFTIGNVTSGSTASATITGTKENPVLSLVLPIPDVPYITEEAEGDIVTIEDAAAAPALSAVAMIEPVQAGEGEPYPPGGGKNLLPFMVVGSRFEKNGMTGVVTEAGLIVNGTPTSTYAPLLSFELSLAPGTYRISGGNRGDIVAQVNVGNEDGTTGHYIDREFQIYGNERFITAYIITTGNLPILENFLVAAQLELGDTATEYAPYANIRPITGHEGCEMVRTGKNLLGLKTETQTAGHGITYTFGDGTYVVLNGTASENTSQVISSLLWLKPGEYTISVIGLNIIDASYDRLLVLDDKQNVLANFATANGPKTFTVSEASRVRVQTVIVSGSTYNNTPVYVQIESGSTATEYQPYQGQTYSATFPQTVYGGSYDFVSGRLTVDRAMVTFDGTEAWTRDSHWINPYAYQVIDKLPGIMPVDGYMSVADILCSHATKNTANDIANNSKAIGVSVGGGTALYISLGIGESTSEFKTFLAAQYAAGTPVQVCYELATPLTYDLTPQQVDMLFGLNNVWSDTGDTKVVYIADTKTYIDSAKSVMRLKDTNTGTVYELKVIDGKLTMTEVE